MCDIGLEGGQLAFSTAPASLDRNLKERWVRPSCQTFRCEDSAIRCRSLFQTGFGRLFRLLFTQLLLALAWALQNCATLIRYVASTSVCILRCVVLAEWVFCLDHCTASLNSAFFRSIFAFWPPITLPQIVHQSPVRVVRMWCLVLVFEIKFQSHRPFDILYPFRRRFFFTGLLGSWW